MKKADHLVIEDASRVRGRLKVQKGADAQPGLHLVVPIEHCSRADAWPPPAPANQPGSVQLLAVACCCPAIVWLPFCIVLIRRSGLPRTAGIPGDALCPAPC